MSSSNLLFRIQCRTPSYRDIPPHLSFGTPQPQVIFAPLLATDLNKHDLWVCERHWQWTWCIERKQRRSLPFQISGTGAWLSRG